MAVKKVKTKKVSKAAFIRKCPADWPAGQVVMDAKNNGIPLTEGYVYNVRSTTRAHAAAAAAKPREKPQRFWVGGKTVALREPEASKLREKIEAKVPRLLVPPAVARDAGKTEQMFLALAAEMGLVNAIGLLEGMRTLVKQVLS